MKSSLMKRIIVLLVSVSFFSTYSLPAWSGIVTTDQLLQQQLEVLNKSSLVAMLDRDDVRQQLVVMTVQKNQRFPSGIPAACTSIPGYLVQ